MSTRQLASQHSAAGPDGPSASALERMPPQDITAERTVLGCMILSKDAIGDAAEVLEGPSDFYRPAHATIYLAILDMYGRDEPVDPITLTAELTRSGDLDRVGGAPYLHDLVQQVPSASHAEHYVTIVRERAVFRGLVDAGTRILQWGFACEGDPAEVADRAQSALLSVVDHGGDTDVLPLSQTALEGLAAIEERSRTKGLRGLVTGFTDVDSLTSGLMPGQMVIVAGRPSLGKSTLALDIARHVSVKNTVPALFFSLEMGRQELMDKVFAAEADQPSAHHLRPDDRR